MARVVQTNSKGDISDFEWPPPQSDLPFKYCLKLKTLGFDEEVQDVWENNTLAGKPVFHQYCFFISDDIRNNALYKTRPGLFKPTNKNSLMPSWLVAAPLLDDVQKWLMIEHDIHVNASGNYFDEPTAIYEVSYDGAIIKFCNKFNDSEKAYRAGIIEGIKFLAKLKRK